MSLIYLQMGAASAGRQRAQEGWNSMAGTFRIKITTSQAKLTSARCACFWSAWLSGKLLGKGHYARPEEGISRAHDLVGPDQVEHIEVVEA